MLFRSERGFVEDHRIGAPICRWVLGDLELDVMPCGEGVLGFSNRWYRAAIDNAQVCRLANGDCIRVISAPYFLACKLDAFRDRGQSDLFGSKDLEDLLIVLDGDPEIVTEIAACSLELQNFLREQFQMLLDDPIFMNALPGLVAQDHVGRGRLTSVQSVLMAVAGKS